METVTLPRFDWYGSRWGLTVYLFGWSLSLGVEPEAEWGWVPVWIKRGYFRPDTSPTGRWVYGKDWRPAQFEASDPLNVRGNS